MIHLQKLVTPFWPAVLSRPRIFTQRLPTATFTVTIRRYSMGVSRNRPESFKADLECRNRADINRLCFVHVVSTDQGDGNETVPDDKEGTKDDGSTQNRPVQPLCLAG